MQEIPMKMRVPADPQLLRQLPNELVEVLRSSANPSSWLDGLALAALRPQCTEKIFAIYEPIFVDLAARWILLDSRAYSVQTIAAFSRILPFARHLLTFANVVSKRHEDLLPFSSLVEDVDLYSLLLAIFRLLSLDSDTFSKRVSPVRLQSLFQHPSPIIRYLAIRCFCLYMRAADGATQDMLEKYIGDSIIEGVWEDRTIDYRFLSLWEERRWSELGKQIKKSRNSRDDAETETWIRQLQQNFTPNTAAIGGVLLPTDRPEPSMGSSSLVTTPTVRQNLRNLASSLLSTEPILLVGLAGSGKTSLANYAAGEMGQASTMITLHLNEQTDSKSLLGVYSTSTQAGSFSWQPGVLTKAAREGRWVLIEDLDRAPSEVLGLILPLIEKRELVIPSRKEHIRCADGFKVIATMRSTINTAGKEITPSGSMLGSRLWNRVPVMSMALEEIQDIIAQSFPLLTPRMNTVMAMYSSLITTFETSLSKRSIQGRSPGLRDLMKFCERTERRLRRAGCETGCEAVSDGINDEIFMDAVDCFAVYLSSEAAQSLIIETIAEQMHISPQRMKYCLSERIPTYTDEPNTLSIGREICPKMKLTKGRKSISKKTTFAPTRSSLRTMERVAAALQLSEPILLVGETGIGKTAVIQQLAALLNQRLTVVNLSQQSESTDLLGGYKPVNLRSLAIPMVDEFNLLFESTFSARKNQKFLTSVSKSAASGNWVRLVTILKEAARMASDVFKSKQNGTDGNGETQSEQPSKRRRLDDPKYVALRQKWESFTQELTEFESRVSQGDTKFGFAFVPGKIVKALRNGEWVLLDEINLASPDTLESIASLLHHGRDGAPSVLLSEAGDVERVVGHPNFRIFGAMNPATDAGKRDLAPGLRSRFTEIYVHSPDTELDDLLGLIQVYLGSLASNDDTAALSLARLYFDTKKLGLENKLTDGAGQKPHFSIRTLVRSLFYVREQAHIYGLRRAIYEGFYMSFLTLLSQGAERLIIPLLDKHLFGNMKNARSVLGQTPRAPTDGASYVQFRHYWMRQGSFPIESQSHYIITPFIERNLMNLVRASSTRRFPILLQGPTSSGKTSMVEYLAKISGNKFVRINNHEHTDLQEYLGTYVSGEDGSLRYQEGVLVEALRNGYWIVLDELNLAPTDVLEALNRLLDDNRELFLPETQEVVHPHPNFMLFATQNPAGLYGGRKILSRAFRNRFLELHFDDIPEGELEYILKERSQIAPSFCTRIVEVYRKLSLLRQSSRLFEQKNSFATLRDLFRWALRRADDREQLAINGFMLLAERVRNSQERAAVKQVIEEVMRVKIDESVIYGARNLEDHLEKLSASPPSGVIWTRAMRRLLVLVSKAIENNEPVLLVGETGCGKTQLCEAVTEIYGKQLLTINAHVNLETGDLIGAQRPVRNRSQIEHQLRVDLSTLLKQIPSLEGTDGASVEAMIRVFPSLKPDQVQTCDPELLNRIRENTIRVQALFEWADGSLITAMKTGRHFLLDEISLADDSVLERLNSVLEPHRSILLAEKGPKDSLIVANEGFQFLATMNPGGDYGKRELSAALRNRLTEIWVPLLSEDDDVLPIIEAKLLSPLPNAPKAMLDFAKWFKDHFQSTSSGSISIRDLLAWVNFVNTCKSLDPVSAMVHGASLVYIDTLGANPSAMLAAVSGDLETDRRTCLGQLGAIFEFDAVSTYWSETSISVSDDTIKIGPFSLEVGPNSRRDPSFALDAPTTVANSLRIARGLQSSKPILLEGSPGVGKTTLVAALADVLGEPLTRINLSDQTDLTDLFGSDVPVEGSGMGNFAWRDAPFLRAMQKGEWVLLDEMNLASQSVLEGLNSCLDHRQQVYISELDQTFKRHPNFVLFAAQNPHHQGGGRKGLPASFVNRFTVVYADSFSRNDLQMICQRISPNAPQDEIEKLVGFISALNHTVQIDRTMGTIGGPWEINLRDISRWLRLLESTPVRVPPAQFLDVVISHRFRTVDDRSRVSAVYAQLLGAVPDSKSYFHNLTPDTYQVGLGLLRRNRITQSSIDPHMSLVTRDLPVLESLILCIEQGWPSILVGPSGCGKSSLLRKLAAMSGAKLVELALNADTDTMDLVGGFEQVDNARHVLSFVDEFSQFLRRQIVKGCSVEEAFELSSDLVQLYQALQTNSLTLESIYSCLATLSEKAPNLGVDEFRDRCASLLNNDASRVGFAWTEGLFIQAVERGHWVVLDNANLCNSSVLDRLNSLMEPNGTLIINEQRTGDGLAKVVTPHPSFRLFLTMDPRHGELSRAMRNRAIEICFLASTDEMVSIPHGITYAAESSTYRVRPSQELHESEEQDGEIEGAFCITLDHLSRNDLDRVSGSSSSVDLCVSTTPVSDATTSLSLYQKLSVEGLLRRSLGDFETVQNGSSGTQVDSRRNFEPLHPLVNEPGLLTNVRAESQQEVIRLAKLQELRMNAHGLYGTLSRLNEFALTKKPSEMTRLERSMVSSRIPALMKETTQPLALFLARCVQALQDLLVVSSEDTLQNPNIVPAISSILDYCLDVIQTAQCTDFDEGIFQTYLQLGRSIYSEFKHVNPDLFEVFSRSLDAFRANWGLSTGQSMQRMWERWRPATPQDAAHLQLMLELQQIASRFDKIILKTNLPIEQLSKLRLSLLNAQTTMLFATEGSGLIQDLGNVIDDLESRIQEADSVSSPYFATEFEALCQYRDLIENNYGATDISSSLLGPLELLAGRPSHPHDVSTLNNAVPELLSKISRFSGFQNSFKQPFALQGTISLSLIDRLTTLGDVPLKAMDLLGSELQIMAHGLSSSSREISVDQISLLQEQLTALLEDLLRCHMDLIEPESFGHVISTLKRSINQDHADHLSRKEMSKLHLNDSLESGHYFRNIASGILGESFSELVTNNGTVEDKYHQAGLACVKLAITCLQLFVPNRPFDPSLGLAVQRQRYSQRISEKTQKRRALQVYETHFSGQSSSLRIKLVDVELQLLGTAPPLPPVTRPQPSQLGELQGEFTNLLNSVLNRINETGLLSKDARDTFANDQCLLLQRNVRQICHRLAENYKAYDDIVIPVVRFLELLDLGIGLSQCSSSESSSRHQFIHAVSETTPFLGSDGVDLSKIQQVEPLSSISDSIQLEIHNLSVLSTSQNTNPDTLAHSSHRHILRDLLDRFYRIWKEQLKSDQKKEAENTSLYRHQGSFEDEQEADDNEFRELFPTFEGEGEGSNISATAQLDTSSVSLKLSRLLGDLFSTTDKQSRLMQLVKASAKLLGTRLSRDYTVLTTAQPKSHLSGAILLLDEAINPLQVTSYNFYIDPNPVEVKKLAELVKTIRSRFYQIQQAWPEHATLGDVINCCSEIFLFRHQEPLAKFITKAEKLHSFIYEWQQVASSEYSAAQVYNDLTSLLISWRRLELSTWGRLLDIEKEKCDQDASAWFFIAYEVIVAVPCQLAYEGQELSDHLEQLVSTLEKFLSSTLMGQFAPRIHLIENFKSLLQLYVPDLLELSKVVSALNNVLYHFKPFVPVFDKILSDGRQPLERNIQEAIQLASWKDTNITALRESARRSHYKLFKTVRKYRAVLSRASDGVLARGLPEGAYKSDVLSTGALLSPELSADTLQACQDNVPMWEQRAARFKDPENSVKSMKRVYESALSDLQAPDILDTFMRDVIESINDFKSSTPKTLTEENKEEVQHLKGQKRRFYAEKLRTLRHMGVRSNVGTDAIDNQRSIAVILSTTQAFNSFEKFPHLQNADSYFHRFLEVVQPAREASRTYSEDLSNVEVARSIGSVEGLLSWILKQRSTLAPRLNNLADVESAVAQMKDLSDLSLGSVCKAQHSAHSHRDIRGTLNWLSTIIGVCITIIQIHEKFARLDSSSVVNSLASWKDRVNQQIVAIKGLTSLPRGLSSTIHEKCLAEAQVMPADIKADVLGWIDARPEMAFALEQILHWTESKQSEDVELNGVEASRSVQDLDSSLLTAMDKIFVTLQRISASLSASPSSTEDPTWLVKADQSMSKALAELHMAEIADSISSVLSHIQYVSETEPNNLVSIAAAVSSVLPLAQQYQVICTDLLHRYCSLHREMCKMSYILAKSFTQVASEGFCNPHESSTEQDKNEKLESGTGLGEGEGAEDISKDVQDDEDLTELAQEKQQDSGKDEIENSKDAVDMDQEELEAEMSDVEQEEKDGSNASDGEEEEDDIDEEVGSVDGLDAGAVDEKLWDGENEEEQKDTENDQGKGENESEDKTAAAEQKKEGPDKENGEQEESDDESMEAPDDEAEAVGGREEEDVTDPYAKEEQVLDLPEDMELDGPDKEENVSDEDEDMDGLSDVDSKWEGEADVPEDSKDEDFPASPDQTDAEADETVEESKEDDATADGEETIEEQEPETAQEEEEEAALRAEKDDNDAAPENVAESEAVSGGQGADQDQNEEMGTSGEATQPSGSKEQTDQQDQQMSEVDEAEEGKQADNAAGGQNDDAVDDSQAQAFKKLGDILEEWHKRQQQIKEASEEKEQQPQEENQDINMEDADFEHLADDQDAADTQALGQANEEQAKALDDSQAVESDRKLEDGEALPDAAEPENIVEPPSLEDHMQLEQKITPLDNNAPKPFIAGENRADLDPSDKGAQAEDLADVDEVDEHLSALHVSSELAPLTSPEEARRLWSHYESVTHDLSLSLTEQLRLILAPTMATKLRGDFRTGKRLNIKRIIPYIASQYKRDKIWMRRSIPSKRNYQIMLAVDDSKSMLESGSGQLAFETLALVAKSLNMLEAGDLCVVSFGDEEHARVAHEFGKPFSSDAGVHIFQQFSFKQTGTNVRKLIADSIALFREAKIKQSRSSTGGDLWQLELIISDGICEDHETIRRLVRQAQEERIMIVFIIVDAVKGSSILDLTQASFEPEGGSGEMKLKMKRYLEGFPFPYYLVVRNVLELPAVLTLALKQWFAEVVDIAG